MPPPPPESLIQPPSDGDVNRGPALNAVVWVLACTSSLFFCLRVYSRHLISRNPGVEDAIMAFGLALILMESGLVSKAVSSGIARHQYYLSLAELSDAIKWQAIAEPIGIIAPCVPRIVIAMLLIKILTPSLIFVVYLWSLNLMLLALSITCSVVVFVQCTPVSAQWTRIGVCWNPKVLANVSIAQGSFAAFVDFALAIFPIPTIWNLQMRLGKRVGVCFLLGLGIFASIAAAVKTSQLTKLNVRADITWELFTLVLWVMIELNVVFICACIPVLRPIWRSHFGSRSTKLRHSSRGRWYKFSGSESSAPIMPSGRSHAIGSIRNTVGDTMMNRTATRGKVMVTRDIEMT